MYGYSGVKMPNHLNIYKQSIKRMLIEQQSAGPADEWPCFMLHSIQGISKSKRNSTINTAISYCRHDNFMILGITFAIMHHFTATAIQHS